MRKSTGLLRNMRVLVLGVMASFFISALIELATPQAAQAAACAAPSPSYGTATMTVQVPATASYRIWSRISTPNTASNSYRLEVDGNTCFTVGNASIPTNSWTWVDYQNGSTSTKINMQLSAGQHTIKMLGSEPSLAIDRIILTADPACVPSGLGNNCLEQPPTNPNGNVTTPFRMNVGGANYTDSNGNLWRADTYFNGGQTNSQGAGKTIANAGSDSALYQDERWGMSGYSIPIANGTYTLALHFAEIYPVCDNKQGCRVFSATAEGKPILTDFDVVKAAGGSYKATVQLSTVTVSDGKLDVGFAGKVNSPILTGLQILPTSGSPSPSPNPNPPTPSPTPPITTTPSTPTPSSSAYNNRLVYGPDNRMYYSRDSKKSYIGNTPQVFCVKVRRGTGEPTRVTAPVINALTTGTEGYCYYEQEPGLNFVREDGTNPVWLVQPGGTKLHVGVLCVPDFMTTQHKKFRLHIVPFGETAGHRQVGTFIGNPQRCGQLPG